MTAYIALLRAMNVGGTGKLSMTDLVEMAESTREGTARNIKKVTRLVAMWSSLGTDAAPE